MNQGGFFEPKGFSPTSLTIVIAIHAAALTALALSKMEVPIAERFGRTIIFTPVDPTPPAPDPIPPKAETDPQPAQPTRPDVPVVNPPIVPWDSDGSPIATLPPSPIPDLPVGPPVNIIPPADPIRIDAQFDPRFGDRLQPPYPLSEQRMGAEGRVTLKVLIGTDGRVKAVRKVDAASIAFFEATEKHALRNWRFKPATVDGKPVESWKQMTVRFELTA